MTFRAGALRDRITLQSQSVAQDPLTGEMAPTWADWLANEPAAFKFMSAREIIAANAAHYAAEAHVRIRWRAGVHSGMRLVFDGVAYNIRAAMPDNKSGREWITLLVSSKNDGA